MIDQLGQPVAPGDTVCYPSRKGARMWLRTLKVLHIDGDRISGLLPTGRSTTIRRQNGTDLVVAKGHTL